MDITTSAFEQGKFTHVGVVQVELVRLDPRGLKGARFQIVKRSELKLGFKRAFRVHHLRRDTTRVMGRRCTHVYLLRDDMQLHS